MFYTLKELLLVMVNLLKKKLSEVPRVGVLEISNSQTSTLMVSLILFLLRAIIQSLLFSIKIPRIIITGHIQPLPTMVLVPFQLLNS